MFDGGDWYVATNGDTGVQNVVAIMAALLIIGFLFAHKVEKEREETNMMVHFQLSMSGVGSWNKRWTGEDKNYSIIRNLPKGKAL